MRYKGEDIPGLVEEYLKGGLMVDDFVTQELKFEDINKAFDFLRDGIGYLPHHMPKAPIERATLRPIVYYEFLEGHSARAATDNICAAIKGNVVHYSTVSRWFKRLESDDTTFGDRPRSGRPSTSMTKPCGKPLNAKPNATTREFAITLGVTHMAIGNHLNDLGYRKTQKYGVDCMKLTPDETSFIAAKGGLQLH
ncbi:unnamed protein product [Darwinula stevensoni]|uniref:Mos1 transposase HTH domain-containing protein n=1 Tax=Darwinula stevensoni TaxID=69355 RepID=A0A7R9FNC8_9CRUS|nr:unnamed protein product [Darwinula stevensoni]CAG0896651.1 unnamed protein product [Darwinula stevensoni]